MHSYELDGRGKVVVVLAAGSVLLVWLLDVALGAADFEPQWWLSHRHYRKDSAHHRQEMPAVKHPATDSAASNL